MPTSTSRVFAPLFALSLFAGCSSSSSDPDDSSTRTAVARTYAVNAGTSYGEALTAAKTLQTAVNAFVAAPSKDLLEAARAAWKVALPAYNRTEVYRFYGGPIDNDETGPEGHINAWPLDENFIDYTKDQPNAGIINDPTTFPDITKELIQGENEKGGEKNLSTGFHAIEFLLWGQDQSATGPGERPYTDYVSGTEGTAANQARRGTYLKLVTELLVDDLTPVVEAWDIGTANSYGAKWVEPGFVDEALANILKGMGSLAGAELSKERMNNAYETKDQEEEHSCFSDTTLDNLYADALGIQNVYLGHFGDAKAPAGGYGLDALVKSRDAELDKTVKANLEATLAAITAIPAPFDQAVQGSDDSEGRKKIKAAMDACAELTTSITKVAETLNIKINLE